MRELMDLLAERALTLAIEFGCTCDPVIAVERIHQLVFHVEVSHDDLCHVAQAIRAHLN